MLATILVASGIATAASADSLPIVDDVDVPSFVSRLTDLLADKEKARSCLPEKSRLDLSSLLQPHGKRPADLPHRLQDLLDPHCLVGVTINPESRVKVARGPARADLTPGRDRFYLVKVHNEAGVTHALSVSGPSTHGDRDTAGWLEATIDSSPSARGLTGQRLEYVLLRLKTDASGKREATLRFDVGQGSQDLGFRAEVPVLFTIRRPSETGAAP